MGRCSHERNARREVLLQQVGKFLLQSIITVSNWIFLISVTILFWYTASRFLMCCHSKVCWLGWRFSYTQKGITLGSYIFLRKKKREKPNEWPSYMSASNECDKSRSQMWTCTHVACWWHFNVIRKSAGLSAVYQGTSSFSRCKCQCGSNYTFNSFWIWFRITVPIKF